MHHTKRHHLPCTHIHTIVTRAHTYNHHTHTHTLVIHVYICITKAYTKTDRHADTHTDQRGGTYGIGYTASPK